MIQQPKPPLEIQLEDLVGYIDLTKANLRTSLQWILEVERRVCDALDQIRDASEVK